MFCQNRVKNNPGSCISPAKDLIAGCYMHIVVLSFEYIGVVNEGLMCLINLVLWEPHR